MSAMSAIEAAGLDEEATAAWGFAAPGFAAPGFAAPGSAGGVPAPRGTAAPQTGAPRARLQLVPAPGGAAELAGRRPAAAAEVPGTRGAASPIQDRPAPLRLTRRGKIVVVFVGVVLATLALTVASMSLSGAQAANHGRGAGGYQGMHQVVVQPGQTLWSIATQAEPSADPRQVISEIMTANSLTSSNVQAGQLLWVPR
jgi:hypothetical protein